ncbi:MAG: 4-alpha-glucanotransferase [Pseudomonadota bacterium]|nr:4-alpha-glucanotransferase [Pseudomonadota bacterium]
MPFADRRGGVLLHPTSLPGGRLGPAAYQFVDFLAAAGITVWQTLPLNPPRQTGSPYDCLSSHGLDPALADPEWLVRRGWIEPGTQATPDAMRRAWQGLRRTGATDREGFDRFVTERAHWLDDFALFSALRESRQTGWWLWPPTLRDRSHSGLAKAVTRQGQRLDEIRFEQFVVYSQWLELKAYANRRGVLLFGDMPIYVARDSADVWSRPDLFKLDDKAEPTVVAGVPPDYFAAQGQRWGNPVYRWSAHEAEQFAWWRARLATAMELFDLMRIDHFRGFEACWEIPAGEPTARNGQWVAAPGDALLRALREAFPKLSLVAENLGVITASVETLRRRYSLPGMVVLQFGFDGDAANPHLPHNHDPLSVVYSGTHDNDTALGWFSSLDTTVRDHVLDYLGRSTEPMPWPLIRAALGSVARLAMLPLQDLLALGSEARMNVPGETEGNWSWRYQAEALTPELADRLRHLVALYGRTV